MRKRCIAMLLVVVMLFDVNTVKAWAITEQETPIQETSKEQNENISDRKTTEQENQTTKDTEQDTENTGQKEECKICFYDEKGESIGTEIPVEKGKTIDLNALAVYFVQGYNVAWKDKKSEQLLGNTITVQENMNLQAVLTPITYQIAYDKNAEDAEGMMQQQDMKYGEDIALKTCAYSRDGYEFSGWALSRDGECKFDDQQLVNGMELVEKEGEVLQLYAIWKKQDYTITYHIENGKNNPQNPEYYNEDDTTFSLLPPTRRGYSFEGWFLEQGFENLIKEIKTGRTGNLDLYAKWKLNVYTITYYANGGTMPQNIERKYSIKTEEDIKLPHPVKEGYTFEGWCTDKKLKKKAIKQIQRGTAQNLKLYAKWSPKKYKIVYYLRGGKNNKKNPATYTINSKVTFRKPTKKSSYFWGWYSDKACKKPIKEIKKGSMGKKVVYAKWEKEYPAKSNSAKITTCKPVKKNTILIKAKVSKRIASSTNKYYLVMTTKSGKTARHVAAKSEKKKKLTFELKTSQNRGFALARYAIAVKKGKKYKIISPVTKYISNLSKLAENKKAYKYGKTKKGLQTVSMSDIISTGAQNMFMNVNVSAVVNPHTTEPEKYVYNGKTYTFAGMGGVLVNLRAANARNVNVTVQINLDEKTLDYAPQLIAKEARERGHLYYTWEVNNNASREYMEAIFCFLSEKFGQKNCYVSNWILGNELNSCNIWCFRGSQSDAEFVNRYAYAFRCLYSAVKSVKYSSKVYTCVDAVWHRKKQETAGMTAKSFLERFSKHLKKIQKNVYWDVSVHPYSVRMDYPEFWNPDSYYQRKDLVRHNEKTGFVTMKNLEVFTKYIKKKYGNKSIIISEIGFDATRSTTNQAAALAYAYNIAACNKMIDAFIIRSYVDEPGDGGLRFGIAGREAYWVYKYMDTKRAEKYTKRYLKVIKKKKKSWKKLVRGYSKRKLIKNWRS